MKTIILLLIIILLISCNGPDDSKHDESSRVNCVEKQLQPLELKLTKKDGLFIIETANSKQLVIPDTFSLDDDCIRLEDYGLFSFDSSEFIFMQYVYSGTAHESYVRVFLLDTITMVLKPVQFNYASKQYTNRLKDGECICKGEWIDFSNNSISSTFFIWKKEDGNCCPTAGKVDVVYNIHLGKGSKIVIKPDCLNLSTESLISIYDIH